MSLGDENQHGYLFLLDYKILTGYRSGYNPSANALVRGCHVDSVALSWCCRIVLYIYVENSSLGLKTASAWQ